MNINSKICSFINDNKTNWRELLSEKNIEIKEENGLAIFNYGICANFFDPVVQEARGIIIYLDTLDVACWPFRKFGNYGEPYADEIDWSTAVVQEKIDGSIIKIWWNKLTKKFQISTNKNIDAKNAPILTESGEYTSFYDVFQKINNKVNTEYLDINYTYIFELTSPETKVIIDWNCTDIHHIGTRNNITGQECDSYIQIPKPKCYKFTTLDQCLEAVKHLNDNGESNEGFVVVDANYNRIKIKTDFYIKASYIKGNINININKAQTILEIILNNDMNEFINYVPDIEYIFKYYDYKLSELIHDVEKFCKYCKILYKRCNSDRKEFALKIKNDRLSYFGFKCIDSDIKAKKLVLDQGPKKLSVLIGNYEENINPKDYL